MNGNTVKKLCTGKMQNLLKGSELVPSFKRHQDVGNILLQLLEHFMLSCKGESYLYVKILYTKTTRLTGILIAKVRMLVDV